MSLSLLSVRALCPPLRALPGVSPPAFLGGAGAQARSAAPVSVSGVSAGGGRRRRARRGGGQVPRPVEASATTITGGLVCPFSVCETLRVQVLCYAPPAVPAAPANSRRAWLMLGRARMLIGSGPAQERVIPQVHVSGPHVQVELPSQAYHRPSHRMDGPPRNVVLGLVLPLSMCTAYAQSPRLHAHGSRVDLSCCPGREP